LALDQPEGGGLVANQDSVKRSFLGVTTKSTLSPDAAAQMALGACRMFDTEVAVATTGVAGDDLEDGGTGRNSVRGDNRRRVVRVVNVNRNRYEAPFAERLRSRATPGAPRHTRRPHGAVVDPLPISVPAVLVGQTELPDRAKSATSAA